MKVIESQALKDHLRGYKRAYRNRKKICSFIDALLLKIEDWELEVKDNFINKKERE